MLFLQWSFITSAKKQSILNTWPSFSRCCSCSSNLSVQKQQQSLLAQKPACWPSCLGSCQNLWPLPGLPTLLTRVFSHQDPVIITMKNRPSVWNWSIKLNRWEEFGTHCKVSHSYPGVSTTSFAFQCMLEVIMEFRGFNSLQLALWPRAQLLRHSIKRPLGM